MVETLVGKGFSVSIYDSNVSLSRVLGANRSYIEQEIPHISTLLKEKIGDVLDNAEIVIVANKGAEFGPAIRSLPSNVAVLDLVRVVTGDQSIKAQYDGIAW